MKPNCAINKTHQMIKCACAFVIVWVGVISQGSRNPYPISDLETLLRTLVSGFFYPYKLDFRHSLLAEERGLISPDSGW